MLSEFYCYPGKTNDGPMIPDFPWYCHCLFVLEQWAFRDLEATCRDRGGWKTPHSHSLENTGEGKCSLLGPTMPRFKMAKLGILRVVANIPLAR